MKKYIFLTLTTMAISYTIYYIDFQNLLNSSGALSKIGLTNHLSFAVWGILTFAALSYGTIIAYQRHTNYKFQYILLAIAAIGMLLTLTCDFDYSIRLQYYLHCIGSLLFSIISGVTLFLLYFLNYKKSIFNKTCTYIVFAVLLSDLVLLCIFKENALIEIVPILIGYILLTITNFREERIKVEA